MNAEHENYKNMDELPGQQVFPATTSQLMLLIGIIVTTFCLSLAVLFSY